jgi:hypothetical protein
VQIVLISRLVQQNLERYIAYSIPRVCMPFKPSSFIEESFRLVLPLPFRSLSMAGVVTTLLLLMYLISTCIAANNRRDDDENMPGLHGNESLRTKAHIAHGTVISIAIVLFFPLGATMVRLFSTKNIIWWHVVWQMTGMFILLVGFGLGCWLSYLHNEVSGDFIVPSSL